MMDLKFNLIQMQLYNWTIKEADWNKNFGPVTREQNKRAHKNNFISSEVNDYKKEHKSKLLQVKIRGKLEKY